MTEDRGGFPDTMFELGQDMAVAKNDLRHAEKRQDEDRRLLYSINGSLLTLVEQVKQIVADFADVRDQFKAHDKRLGILEDWKTSHTSGVATRQSFIGAAWGAVISALTVAGIYLGLIHHGTK